MRGGSPRRIASPGIAGCADRLERPPADSQEADLTRAAQSRFTGQRIDDGAQWRFTSQAGVPERRFGIGDPLADGAGARDRGSRDGDSGLGIRDGDSGLGIRDGDSGQGIEDQGCRMSDQGRGIPVCAAVMKLGRPACGPDNSLVRGCPKSGSRARRRNPGAAFLPRIPQAPRPRRPWRTPCSASDLGPQSAVVHIARKRAAGC